MVLACQAMNTALEVYLSFGMLELDEEAIGMETEKMESSAVPAYRAAVLMYRANGNRTMLVKQIRRCVEKVQKMRTELFEDEGLVPFRCSRSGRTFVASSSRS